MEQILRQTLKENILMRSIHFDPKRRSGIAAVEFAMVAPLLCLLIIGMFEVWRGMNVRVILNDAARKGCRTGILARYGNWTPPATDPLPLGSVYDDVVNVMRDNQLTSTNFNPQIPTSLPSGQTTGGPGSITITVTDANGNTVNGNETLDAPPGSYVSVRVTIPVSSVLWTTSYFLPNTSLESETVVMVKQ